MAFLLLLPHGGAFPKGQPRGWEIVENNLVFQTSKVVYGSTPTFFPLARER